MAPPSAGLSRLKRRGANRPRRTRGCTAGQRWPRRVDRFRAAGCEMPGKGDNRGVGELPAGTVTMLFSEIEGSTALLNRLGERYGEALSAQRSLMRAAVSARRGHEMGTEGDSFFVVFESAGDAVGCCLAA